MPSPVPHGEPTRDFLYRVEVEGGGSFLYDPIDVGRLMVRMAEEGDTRAVRVSPAPAESPEDERAEDARNAQIAVTHFTEDGQAMPYGTFRPPMGHDEREERAAQKPRTKAAHDAVMKVLLANRPPPDRHGRTILSDRAHLLVHTVLAAVDEEGAAGCEHRLERCRDGGTGPWIIYCTACRKVLGADPTQGDEEGAEREASPSEATDAMIDAAIDQMPGNFQRISEDDNQYCSPPRTRRLTDAEEREGVREMLNAALAARPVAPPVEPTDELRTALAEIADQARHALLADAPGPQMLNAKWVLDRARAALVVARGGFEEDNVDPDPALRRFARGGGGYTRPDLAVLEDNEYIRLIPAFTELGAERAEELGVLKRDE